MGSLSNSYSVKKLNGRNENDGIVQNLLAIHASNERGTIAPGFYRPACREDGNPMEDEAKLQFFTGPLPGYEAGRRVPVNVMIAGADHLKSTLLSPPIPELRTTTSDTPLRNPQWGAPENRGEMVSDDALQVNAPNRELLRNLALGHSAKYCLHKIPPMRTKTCDFGVIGDGRSTTSSRQNNEHLAKAQANPSRLSIGRMSPFLDSPVHPDLQAWPIPKESNACVGREPFISQPEASGIMPAMVSEALPHGRRSRSVSISNPRLSSDSKTAILGRVSRPVISLTASCANKLEETSQQLVSQPSSPPSGILIDPNVPPVWKRGGPSFATVRSQSNQVVIPRRSSDGSRFDPDTFTLPFGSKVFIMKPRHIDDIRASIKNGIWCSSTNGNKVLKEAWNHRKPGEMILLLFSVIGSSQYCGLAEVTGPYNADAEPDIFLERCCRGIFPIRWIVIKDVPFPRFEDISLRTGKINQLRNAESPPADAGRAMVRTYIEASHSDTHILEKGNVGDTQNRMFAKTEPVFHMIAHLPHARIPTSLIGHNQGVIGIADTSSSLRPGLYHSNIQSKNSQPQRSGALSGYHNISGLRRPDTIIHIYNNPFPSFSVDGIVDPRTPKPDYDQSRRGYSGALYKQKQGHSGLGPRS